MVDDFHHSPGSVVDVDGYFHDPPGSPARRVRPVSSFLTFQKGEMLSFFFSDLNSRLGGEGVVLVSFKKP